MSRKFLTPIDASIINGTGTGNSLRIGQNWMPFQDGNNYYDAGGHNFRTAAGVMLAVITGDGQVHAMAPAPTLATELTRKDYVDLSVLKERSKGGGLVVNGSGLLGTNYNFIGFTFVPTDHPPGTVGSFLAPPGQYQALFTDEFMPVNPSNSYIIGCWARETVPAAVPTSHLYTGVACFDASDLPISPHYVSWQPNTTTTLAAALNPGNTTITLTSAANWNNAAGANDHYRTLIAWNYVDALGYAWPTETYSRNVWLGIYNDGAISGNTITLNASWAGPAIPAGTVVSNGTAGGSYLYAAWIASPTTTEWAWRDNKDAPITGINTGGSIPTTKFPQGTVKAKLVFLCNYGSAASRNAIAGVIFEEYGPRAVPNEVVISPTDPIATNPTAELWYKP